MRYLRTSRTQILNGSFGEFQTPVLLPREELTWPGTIGAHPGIHASYAQQGTIEMDLQKLTLEEIVARLRQLADEIRVQARQPTAPDSAIPQAG